MWQLSDRVAAAFAAVAMLLATHVDHVVAKKSVVASGPGMSRDEFLSKFRGTCFHFMGDSLTREMHFGLLSFGYACGERAALRDPRFSSRAGTGHKAACRVFTRELRNRRRRTTRIPVDRDPRNDIEIRFNWAPRMRDLVDPEPLLQSLDNDSCDFFILNVGAWELGVARIKPAMYKRAFEKMLATLMATPGRATKVRSRVVWRYTLPVEKPRGSLTSAVVLQSNSLIEKVLKENGIRTYNGWDDMLQYKRRPLTRDGLHPAPAIQMSLARHLLLVVEAMLPGAPSRGRNLSSASLNVSLLRSVPSRQSPGNVTRRYPTTSHARDHARTT